MVVYIGIGERVCFIDEYFINHRFALVSMIRQHVKGHNYENNVDETCIVRTVLVPFNRNAQDYVTYISLTI